MAILSSASGLAPFAFDEYDQLDVPPIYLSNPDEVVLYNLGTIYNRKFELRYNTTSTFTFTAPSHIAGEATDYYKYLQYRRLVTVEDVGIFMITGVEIANDGLVEIKNVECKSLEVILGYKNLTLFEGVYTFDAVVSGSGVTSTNLMTELEAYIPGWTFNTSNISDALKYKTRYFEITDKSLYDFMVNDVSQSYQCIFVFDSLTKTIYAYDIDDATTPTDIFVSFDNLIKGFTISESTEEMVTAMTVVGGEDISVALVNPLGNDILYDFHYYKNTDWMNQSLISNIDTWEYKINYYQPTYSNLLTTLRIENNDLVSLQSRLSSSQIALNTLIVERDAAIQAGFPVTDISASIVRLNTEIEDGELEIDFKEQEVNTTTGSLVAINTELSFSNNFTAEQQANLNNFIIGNAYTNVNMTVNNLATPVDIQNVAQELYDEGQSVLAKVSEPRYTFEIDSSNFLFLKDYQTFIDQLTLGCSITVELNEAGSAGTSGSLVAVVLGVDYNYDDPTDFKITLSNRLRMDDDQFQYSDLFANVMDSGTTTAFNSQKWNAASSALASVEIGGIGLVSGTTTSTASSIALYSDTTGLSLKDGLALYKSPTSYVPTFYSAGATFTSSGSGYYSIIGRSVFFEVCIECNSLSGTTGNPLHISIPVLHKSARFSAQLSIAYGNISFNNNARGITATIKSGGSQLDIMQYYSASSLRAISASNVNATSGVFYINGTYLID